MPTITDRATMALSPPLNQFSPLTPAEPPRASVFTPSPGPNAAHLTDEINALLFMVQVRYGSCSGLGGVRRTRCATARGEAYFASLISMCMNLLTLSVSLLPARATSVLQEGGGVARRHGPRLIDACGLST
jgi:hypothetical protein